MLGPCQQTGATDKSGRARARNFPPPPVEAAGRSATQVCMGVIRTYYYCILLLLLLLLLYFIIATIITTTITTITTICITTICITTITSIITKYFGSVSMIRGLVAQGLPREACVTVNVITLYRKLYIVYIAL